MFLFSATFAVQGLNTTVKGNRIVLTCLFMEGFPASGCHIKFTHTTSGKQDVISIYKNVTLSITVYAQHNGSYDVSVYDIDTEGNTVPVEAFTTVILVESSNIQAASPAPTVHIPLPNSTTSPQPSTTINSNKDQWEICE